MANYTQAPRLKFQGNNNKSTKKEQGLQYYGIRQDIADVIFKELDGKNGNQIKIMCVLLGTQENFGISEKWICDRTGMSQPAYARSRKALIDKGWITVGEGLITVNIDNIMKETKEKEVYELTEEEFNRMW